jgi:hypothetical protein
MSKTMDVTLRLAQPPFRDGGAYPALGEIVERA